MSKNKYKKFDLYDIADCIKSFFHHYASPAIIGNIVEYRLVHNESIDH